MLSFGINMPHSSTNHTNTFYDFELATSPCYKKVNLELKKTTVVLGSFLLLLSLYSFIQVAA